MSWINITPGQKNNNKEYISLPLKENGYDWIKYKSIHWGPGLEFDGEAGGVFKYNILTKKVIDISPIQKAIGITNRRDSSYGYGKCKKW